MNGERAILEAISKSREDIKVLQALQAERHEANQKSINVLFKLSREINEKVLCNVIHEQVKSNSRSIKWILGLMITITGAVVIELLTK